jgi:hypothetical protein
MRIDGYEVKRVLYSGTRSHLYVVLSCLNNDDCIKLSQYHFIDGNPSNGSRPDKSSQQKEYKIQLFEDIYFEDAETMSHTFSQLSHTCESR